MTGVQEVLDQKSDISIERMICSGMNIVAVLRH